MSFLDAPAEQLAEHLKKSVRADPILPTVPLVPVAHSVYVWPADPWVTEPDDDDGAFCDVSAGLVVDVVAPVTNLVASQTWLAARVAEIWSACSAGVDVGGDTTRPTSASRPFVIAPAGGELLAVRIDFARFNLQEA